MSRSELPLQSAANRSKVTDTALAELLGFVLQTVFSVRCVLRPRKQLIVQTSRLNVIQSRSVAMIGRWQSELRSADMQLLIFFVNYRTVTFPQHRVLNKLYHYCVLVWHELAVLFLWDVMCCVCGAETGDFIVRARTDVLMCARYV
jgi:hypothetical protein